MPDMGSFATDSSVVARRITRRSNKGTETMTSNPIDARFRYSLNTSTIRGAELPLDRELEIAAKAGFAAIEPWIEEIERYVTSGGTLNELSRRISDLGLSVAGAVGFAEWIVPDQAQRARGLERLKREMEFVAALGGRHIAAPPIGAHQADQPHPSLNEAADRYRAILELGERTGVTPVLELWGFSATLSRLGEVIYVATEAAHPNACLLLDSYHLYKGGSDFGGIHLLNGSALPVFHINDYPADPPRDRIDDADRVYPGHGVAPLGDLFRTLDAIGFRGYLSVELFNPSYWKQPAESVAQQAIEETRQAVRAAFAAT
jgi:2-keto-myo-inositol isomerase